MPTTTTNPWPHNPLPDGTHILGDFCDEQDDHRVISTDAKTVDATELLVSAVATQLAYGTINADEEHDKPLVFVDKLDDRGYSCERLTIGIEGARNLAQALLAGRTPSSALVDTLLDERAAATVAESGSSKSRAVLPELGIRFTCH